MHAPFVVFRREYAAIYLTGEVTGVSLLLVASGSQTELSVTPAIIPPPSPTLSLLSGGCIQIDADVVI